MKIHSEKLIIELINLSEKNISDAQSLAKKTIEELNWRNQPNSWSALECIAHLNFYHDFYLPEISKCIAQSKTQNEVYFVPGIIGNYFVQSIKPKEDFKKMKTLKITNPIDSQLSRITIERFINQQTDLIEHLNKAKQISLSNNKTSISISKLIKFRLGDTFRFVIYHNRRHINQAVRVINSFKQNES